MTSSAAARVRRCQFRKKAGLNVLRIEVPLGPLADLLASFLANGTPRTGPRSNAHCSECPGHQAELRPGALSRNLKPHSVQTKRTCRLSGLGFLPNLVPGPACKLKASIKIAAQVPEPNWHPGVAE
jgi:hypothetical protein